MNLSLMQNKIAAMLLEYSGLRLERLNRMRRSDPHHNLDEQIYVLSHKIEDAEKMFHNQVGHTNLGIDVLEEAIAQLETEITEKRMFNQSVLEEKQKQKLFKGYLEMMMKEVE